MDPNTAFPPGSPPIAPSSPPLVPPGYSQQMPDNSPFKKLLPLVLVVVVLMILFSGILVLSVGKSGKQQTVPTPTLRPTATPFVAPTMPMVSPSTSSLSANLVTPIKIGRLSFIRDGDIYNSDLATYSLLVKNDIHAADMLSWSPDGNFLAWREKTTSATPSAIMIYKRNNKRTFEIKPFEEGKINEVIDYAWSPDESQMSVLSHGTFYNLNLYSLISSSSGENIVGRSEKIKQIVWPNPKTILFSGSDGITAYDLASNSASLIVDNPKVMHMNLSPDHKKLLYSIGDNSKSDLYTINIDGTDNKQLPLQPVKIDMGTTNLPQSILEKGFIPYAVWMPDSNNLLVGYHYITNLPLVGKYNLQNNSFTAIAPFMLYQTDIMVDSLRLLGNRVNTFSSAIPTWQISLFTLEDNANLGLVRVIPDASSPAFFGNDILPGGNTF
ncbi:hypothetical protein M1271_01910 [Patescibacteria group bacterium]|nr:hypothetical protein [Patescibacteria group bacterium]